LKGMLGPLAPSCLSLCFLAAIRWAALLHHAVLRRCSASAWPRNNKVSWSWAETSENLSQNKPLLPLSFPPQVFCYNKKLTNIPIVIQNPRSLNYVFETVIWQPLLSHHLLTSSNTCTSITPSCFHILFGSQALDTSFANDISLFSSPTAISSRF
jgi:hypothetical protein